MFKILLFVFAFLSSSTIALGADTLPQTEIIQLKAKVVGVDDGSVTVADNSAVAPAEEHKPVDMIHKVEPDYTSTDFLSKLMSMLAALYMGMWTLGEILTRISVWTENKWDNKLAERVSQVTWFIGAFCGRMGWKLPKLVIEHEAEKIAAKKASTSSDSAKV